jgi:hypothetical protein
MYKEVTAPNLVKYFHPYTCRMRLFNNTVPAVDIISFDWDRRMIINGDYENAVFLDVAPCRSYVNRRFGGTSVHIRSTRRHIPEDGILHSHGRVNLKSYKWWLVENWEGGGRGLFLSTIAAFAWQDWVKNGKSQSKQLVTVSGSVMCVFKISLIFPDMYTYIAFLRGSFAAFFHDSGDDAKHVHSASSLYMWEGR